MTEKMDADRKTYQDIQERMVSKINTTLEEMNASQKEMLAKRERMTNAN
jgi:hypothetical protein